MGAHQRSRRRNGGVDGSPHEFLRVSRRNSVSGPSARELLRVSRRNSVSGPSARELLRVSRRNATAGPSARELLRVSRRNATAGGSLWTAVGDVEMWKGGASTGLRDMARASSSPRICMHKRRPSHITTTPEQSLVPSDRSRPTTTSTIFFIWDGMGWEEGEGCQGEATSVLGKIAGGWPGSRIAELPPHRWVRQSDQEPKANTI